MKGQYVALLMIGGVIGLLLILILVPLSFSYVEYNQYAFKKNTATSVVDTSEVYEAGTYAWGLGNTPVIFPRTFQLIEYTPAADGSLTIFTDDGLQITIECSFQYRLIKANIAALYHTFGLSFGPQVVNIAKSILKNVAPSFTTQDYYVNRDKIESQMEAALATGLLNETFVEVGQFQLRTVTLPTNIATTLLNTQIQAQNNAREVFVQNATVIRAQTLVLQQETLSNITRIRATAQAQATLIAAQASAQAIQIRATSKQTGLRNLFGVLNLTTPELKLAFLYTTRLGQTNNTKLLVGITDPLVTV